MSIDQLQRGIKITLKGDGAAPWITVGGDDVTEVERHMGTVLGSRLFQHAAEASTLLTSAVRVSNGLSAPATEQAPPVQQQQQGQYTQQVTSAAPNPPQQGGFGPPNPPQQGGFGPGRPHPEGKHCPKCGAAVIGKEVKSWRMWSCPNQREKGDGHFQEWLR